MPSLLVAHHCPGIYLRTIERDRCKAGDAIRKLSDDAGQMTIVEIDAPLYLPHRARRGLERALKIPVLSDGWNGSLRELPAPDEARTASSPPLAWHGLRTLRVSAISPEAENIIPTPLTATLICCSRPNGELVLDL